MSSLSKNETSCDALNIHIFSFIRDDDPVSKDQNASYGC